MAWSNYTFTNIRSGSWIHLAAPASTPTLSEVHWEVWGRFDEVNGKITPLQTSDLDLEPLDNASFDANNTRDTLPSGGQTSDEDN